MKCENNTFAKYKNIFVIGRYFYLLRKVCEELWMNKDCHSYSCCHEDLLPWCLYYAHAVPAACVLAAQEEPNLLRDQ